MNRTTNKVFCTTSETEGEVGPAKVESPLLIKYLPFKGGSSVVVLC